MALKISNRLREFRSLNRLTQEQLAIRLGVSRQTIISIERGRYDPGLALVFKIIEFFQCSFEEMFSSEGIPELERKGRKVRSRKSIPPAEESEDPPLRNLPFLD